MTGSRLLGFVLAAGVPAAAAQDAASKGLTAVAGVKVGHHTLRERPTGCTVVLTEAGAVAGVDVRGGAPGTRETDLLDPVDTVQKVNAIVLAGGSAFGLDAAGGAVRWLEEKGFGYDTRVAKVPIVPAAILFDLGVGGDPKIRPTAECGYAAAQAATDAPVAEGSVGAGAGATVGKLLVRRGMPGMKGGVGGASARLGDVVIAALVVVNASGDIVDWRQGTIVAGARTADGRGFARTVEVLRRDLETRPGAAAPLADDPLRATTLGVVATNVALTKTQLTKLAMMANTGAARAINPYHTQSDGDQVLAVSTGLSNRAVSLTTIGAIAADVLADAIVRAVRAATGVPGWIAVRDL